LVVRRFQGEAADLIENGSNQQTAALPDWGSKELKTGTLRAVIKQLGIIWEDFEEA
jgi:mRNA interferase HicA